jgi:hypothetical protein
VPSTVERPADADLAASDINDIELARLEFVDGADHQRP